MSENELMQFISEEPKVSEPAKASGPAWQILIIDDEKDVHSATKFALRNTLILGRPLEFLHASSAREAIDILTQTDCIAVILLDVVMETPNAGLDLVVVIREELNNTQSRIILRTGQPNQAPELDVIRDYDINDYKLKSELTQNKLFASLTTAVRSYHQIKLIEASTKGLNQVVRSSSELMKAKGLAEFSNGVIAHLCGLLSIPVNGLVCIRPSHSVLMSDPIIIASDGDYVSYNKSALSVLEGDIAKELIIESLDTRTYAIEHNGLAVHIGSSERGALVCFVKSTESFVDLDKSLLEMFVTNISICADNIDLVERLSRQAYRDALLDMPNRNAIVDEVNMVKEVDMGQEYLLAVIDVDNFAEINAALGQEYGDLLLKAIAKRMRSSFPPPSMVARIAGDTFGVFGPADYISATKILNLFSNPFEIGSDQQIISVTSGIVPLSEVDGGGNDAIKNASIVLKVAKISSRGQVVNFKRNMAQNASDRLDMLRSLRTDFENEKLFLAFQPKFNIDASRVEGFEALLRWKDSSGKFISPAEFIPLAEQSGLIVRMGEWIMRMAINALQRIHEWGWNKTHMSINLSVAQLHHPEVIDMLQSVLNDCRMDPQFIELEITESMAMGDIESSLTVLNRIKALGFSVSIDDFGTGFSSLNYLQKMPIDRLKIDQSFVRTSSTESGREIVEMIIHLARTLDLTVVAEGVETIEELAILRQFDCDEIQGYLYARPMASLDLFAWMEANKANYNC